MYLPIGQDQIRGRSGPTRKSLDGAIGALRLEARQELMAPVWLGQADRDATFEQHLAHAKRNPEKTDTYYIGEESPHLPEYLRAGLNRLGQSRGYVAR